MKDLKVVFMGTPEFAVTILEKLIENTEVVMVVSQPDAPVGRKKTLTPSPVKKFAEEKGIEVFTPSKIKENYEQVLNAKPDMIVTCAYGQIIPKELLEIPKYGCINVHASLLPKLRGGAPIHRAIMEGFKETGITIMHMDEHMDSGDIITQEKVTIEDDDTLETLSEKLKTTGANLLIKTIPQIIDNTAPRIKQNEDEITFGYIIKKEDEHLDFNETTQKIYDQIRALYPNPASYFTMDGKNIKVYKAKKSATKGTPSTINNIYKDGIGIGTKDGEIILTEIKPEGKNRILVKDYLNGIDKNKLKGSIVNVK